MITLEHLIRLLSVAFIGFIMALAIYQLKSKELQITMLRTFCENPMAFNIGASLAMIHLIASATGIIGPEFNVKLYPAIALYLALLLGVPSACQYWCPECTKGAKSNQG